MNYGREESDMEFLTVLDNYRDWIVLSLLGMDFMNEVQAEFIKSMIDNKKNARSELIKSYDWLLEENEQLKARIAELENK